MQPLDWLNRESLLSAAGIAENCHRHFGLKWGEKPDVIGNLGRLLPKSVLKEIGIDRHVYRLEPEERGKVSAWLDTLPAQYATPDPSVPMAGDAVACPAGMCNVKPGGIGIIGGEIGQPMRDRATITWNHSTFRGHSFRYPREGPSFVSCSGGPGLFLSPERLTPTGKTHTYTAWQWYESAQANGGCSYHITVPLWEYAPKDGEWGYSG